MGDDKTAQPGVNPGYVTLLEEGAKSYLDALTAVTVFQREIRSRCQKVLEGRLSEYGQALNVTNLCDYPVTSWMISEAQINGTFAVLGVQQRGFSLPSAQCWCGSHLGLCWDHSKTSPWFGVSVAMGFGNITKCEELFRALKAQGISDAFTLVKDEDYRKTIWFSKTLAPTDMAVIEEKLDEVLSAWIQLWRQYLRPSTKDSADKKGSEIVS